MKSSRYPIEVYVLLIPGIVILLADTVLNSILGSRFDFHTLSRFWVVIDTGGEGFAIGFQIVSVLISLYLFYALYKYFVGRHFGSGEEKANESKIGYSPYLLIRSYVLLLLLVGILSWSACFSLDLLFMNIPLETAIKASLRLMNFEYSFFNTFPPFVLQKYFPVFIEKIIAFSYFNTTWVMGVTTVLMLVFSKLKLRALIISYFLTFFVGFIFWWLVFPALSPGIVYYLFFNAGLHIPAGIAKIFMNFHVSSYLHRFVYTLNLFWFQPTSPFLAVSNFPSLHAAWGMLAVYFGTKLYRPLALFYVPWSIFNFIGTFYLLQHYVLDSIAGVFLGLMAIFVSVWLVQRDERDKVDDSRLYYAVDVLNKNALAFIERFKLFVGRKMRALVYSQNV